MVRKAARIAAGIAGLATLGGTVVAGTGVAIAGPARAESPATAAAWRIVKRMASGPAGDLTTVVATGKSSGWAFNGDPATTPTAWERNGNSWTQAAFPGELGEQVVAASATSRSDVWAFTLAAFGSRALRWNGRKWYVVHTFKGLIGGASVVSRSDVWVFGASEIVPQLGAWHYNGRRWSKLSASLDGGSALSATSVWAFGGTSVDYYNGRKWSRTNVAKLLPRKNRFNDPLVAGIYAQSATSVYAIGNGQQEDDGGPTVVLHYNGRIWSKVAEGDFGSGTIPFGPQISPDGRGGFWLPMPGYGGQPSYVLHYSAGKLINVPLPRGPYRIDVTSVAQVPGTTEMLGGGFTHTRTDPTAVDAVILQYGG
jgi:hypothetical protein